MKNIQTKLNIFCEKNLSKNDDKKEKSIEERLE